MTDKPNRLQDIMYGGRPPKVALLEEARALRARLRVELGEREARRIWAEVGKVDRGRVRGEKIVNVAPLMAEYDRMAANPQCASLKRNQIANAVALKAHVYSRGTYGLSADSIAKTIMRELAKRAALEQEMRAALDAMPPAPNLSILASLLTGAIRPMPDGKSPHFMSGGHKIPDK